MHLHTTVYIISEVLRGAKVEQGPAPLNAPLVQGLVDFVVWSLCTCHHSAMLWGGAVAVWTCSFLPTHICASARCIELDGLHLLDLGLDQDDLLAKVVKHRAEAMDYLLENDEDKSLSEMLGRPERIVLLTYGNQSKSYKVSWIQRGTTQYDSTVWFIW